MEGGRGELQVPVRVLWLTKGLGRGGTERLLVGSVRHLDRSRYDVEVAYVLPWKDAFVADLEAAGVRVHCLGRGRSGRLAWPRRLQRLVRDRGYGIVHTHMPQPAVVVRLLPVGRRPGPILVHTEHNLWSRYRPLTRVANRATYGRNQAVLAVSASVAASIVPLALPRSWAPPPVEVVIHGVDTGTVMRGPAARAAARRRLGLDPDELVLANVGNFTAKKDHQGLLVALSQLVAVYPRLRLVLVGAGPLESSLRTAVDRLHLGRHVLFAGSRDDVLEILAAFDVFVLNSRFEGLPIALVEAMAAGLPCVATSVGGIPEVLDHEVEGFLVPHDDPANLAAAVGKLLDDATLRVEMGERAARRAEGLQLDGAVARLQVIYRTLLTGS